MKKTLQVIGLTVALLGTANVVTAQNIGIQFSKMPVGTKAFYARTNGDKWTDVYKGVKSGEHVVERFSGHRKTSGRPIQTLHYDSQGRLVFYRAYGDRSKPYKVAYKPFSCYYIFGNCTHTERFSGNGYVHSGSSEKWVMNTKAVKGGFSTKWYKKRDPSGGNTYFSKLGQFNLRTIEAWGSEGRYNIKLVKLKTP
jgi:hypothetical protein